MDHVTSFASVGISRQDRLKSILGGSIGNLIEWYDWYVYSAFTLYFAPVFFPSDDSTAQLLNAAAIFAVGFLMRPIGAWIMGIYADRKGRKAGLTLSVMLMAGGSLMIAAIPGYASIGVAAPVLLLLARLMQGLSIGGEYGASATYLSEMAQKDQRGFFSSFQYVTLIAGQLLALCVLLLLQLFLTEHQLESWGWRIPFVIGGLMAVGVCRLRRGLKETEAFEESAAVREQPRSSGLNLIRRHPREVLLVMALTAGGTLAFYAYSTYMQKFLVNSAGFAGRPPPRSWRRPCSSTCCCSRWRGGCPTGSGASRCSSPSALPASCSPQRSLRRWKASPLRSAPFCWCWPGW